MDKVFDTSSGEMVHYDRVQVQFLLYRKLLLVLTKCSFWEEEWVLVYNPMKFYDFPDIYTFLKSLRLKSFSNSYIPCLLLRIRLYFTCGIKKIWSNIKKSQNIMTMILVEKNKHSLLLYRCVKIIGIRSYSGPHFPAFGLNTIWILNSD